MKLARPAMMMVTVALLAVTLVTTACSRVAAQPSPTPTAILLPNSVPAAVVKPKPVVLGVNATTSGIFENYFAILDITVRNDGADGMIMLIGNVNQANANIKGELPLYLARNMTETVRIVLPLKWRGGEWTPSAVTEVP